MRELKREFNIHIIKEPMIKRYRQALLVRYKKTGIKPHGCSFKQFAIHCMEERCERPTVGGFILNVTGDVKINYEACANHYKNCGHNSIVGQIVAIISHEFMHYLFTSDEQTNADWDNIAMELEKNGYLGSE